MKRILKLCALTSIAGFIGVAHAHITHPLYDSGACSPHGAGGSQGGSVFTSCAFQNVGYRWDRDFTCAKGTGCSNALCSGKSAVAGHTYITDYSDSSHGGGGGHSPNGYSSCTCTSSGKGCTF